MAKHHKVQANERVHPVMRGYHMACCDCGLVHKIDFIAVKVTRRYKDGTWRYRELDLEKFRVVFEADRHNRATAQVRRWKKDKRK
jgi:hypothetical protein